MNIQDVKVDGFGVWNGLRLGELGDALTVFHGPNEAGKSTLMQFVRSVLFGFSPERRARYLPPVRGGRGGGALRVVSPRGMFEIQRVDDGGPPPALGQSRVLGPDGSRQPDHLLGTLLSGVDEPIFNNIFAVGLREMQELGTLSDAGAGALLYRLTTGLDRVSLSDVMRELTASRNRLLSHEDGRGKITQLLGERERLLGEIDSLRGLSREYVELSAQRDHVSSDVRVAEAEQADLDRAVRVVEVAHAVRDKWHDRSRIEHQLGELEGLTGVPEGHVERYAKVKHRLASRTAQLAGWKRERAQLAAQIGALKVDENLCSLAPRIEGMAEQQPWASTLEAEIEKLAEQRAKLEHEITAHGGHIDGIRPTGVPIHAGAVSNGTLKRLRPVARNLLAARKSVMALKDQKQRAATGVATLKEQIQTSLSGRKDKDLPEAIEKATELVGQLRDRVKLDERVDQLARHRRELADQHNELLDGQLMPAPLVTGLGAAFVVGAVLLMGAVFFGSMLGPTAWTFPIIGLAAMGLAAGGKYVHERTAAGRLDECHQQLTLVEAEWNHAKQQRDDLDAQLPRGGGPLTARLQTAEKELRALEELMAVDGRRQSASNETGSLRSAHRKAMDQLQEAKRRWQGALASVGLPPETLPSHLRQLSATRQQIDDMCRELDRCRELQEERRRDYEAFQTRLVKLLEDAKFKPTGRTAAEMIRQLQDRLNIQQQQLAHREALRNQRLELGRQGKHELRGLRNDRRERVALLRKVGVKNEPELRRLADDNIRSEKLHADHDRLCHEISLALGPHVPEQSLQEYFERVPDDQHEQHANELNERRRGCQNRLQKLLEQRGQLNQQIAQLAQDRRLPSKMLDLGVVEQQLAEAMERWQVLAVTHRLLESIHRTYEADHQPETLRDASIYLKELTLGHYTRVWTPLEGDILRVDDSGGQTLDVERLSAGTREQLFLALRLALVGAFGRRGAHMPLVLDDVLVNFDESRVEAAARVLKRFAAQGYQVLMFTCHDHIARIFANLGVSVRELPSNSAPAVSVKPVAPPPPEPEPEPTPEPEPELLVTIAPPPKPIPAPEPIEVLNVEPARPRRIVLPVMEHEPPRPIEPMEAPPARKRPIPRPTIQVRRRPRSEPFASANWHERIDDDLEERTGGLNGARATLRTAKTQVETLPQESEEPDAEDFEAA